MNGRPWEPWESSMLRIQYPFMKTRVIALLLDRKITAVYQRARLMGLEKSAEFYACPASGRTTGRQGIGTRFAKGNPPANKGLRRPGWHRGRMKETQFKKGVRQGIAVKLRKPIGAERISKDDYLERKVNNDLPLQRRWKAVHRIIWEEAYGAPPAGHHITFKNGDKRDIRLENLVPVSRAEMMKRNTIHNLPKPIAQVVQLRGALMRQIRRRTHGKQN